MSEPREPSSTYYKDIAVDPAATVCLRSSLDTLVDVVNVQTGQRVSLHETVFSFGGQRLAVSDDTEHFIAGSWGNPGGGGVACYETRTGRPIWHNRQMGRPQLIDYERTTDSWYVSRSAGGTLLLDRRTGTPRARIKGCFRGLCGHDPNGMCLVEHRNGVEIIDPRSGNALGMVRMPRMYEWIAGKDQYGYDDRVTTASFPSAEYQCQVRDRFWAISADASGDRLIIAHNSGSLQCFTISDGKMHWELPAPLRSHFLAVGICERDGVVWGRCWSIDNGGVDALWEVDLKRGKLRSERAFPRASGDGVFRRDATVYVDGSGILDLRTGAKQPFN